MNMYNEPDGPGLRDATVEYALRVLRRRWPVVVGIAVIAAIAGVATAKLQHKEYTATASLLFGSSDLSSIDQDVAGISTPIPTNAQLQMDTNTLLLTQGKPLLAPPVPSGAV